jgi:predicted dehydrogenase
MQTLRIAVLGAGLIGQKHIELVAASRECALAAICDADPARSDIAARYGVPFYQDLDRLLAAHALDGAIVATPTALHASHGIACAERGVHLLIEKPIAAALGEARQLLETAERFGSRVLVGHHRRHNALIQQARAIVQSGEIGNLVAVSVLWALLKPDDYFDVSWRKEPGGGPVLINLIHELDNLRFLCGEIQSVYADTAQSIRGLEVEDTASISLRFENGALGTLLASDAAPAPWSYEMSTGENPVYPRYPQDCYHLLGTRGSLAFPSMTLWRYPSPENAGWHQPLEQIRIDTCASDPLVEQLRHFCRVIRGTETPIVSGVEGYKTLAATLAVLESARRGSPVSPADLV